MDKKALENVIPEEILCALKLAYANASKLKITKSDAKRLMKPFPDNAVEIRPDGAIYVPHIYLSERLNQVFGPGAWVTICKDHYEDTDINIVYGEHVLVIRECYVGEAMGERSFTGMDRYSDALETTIAEALRRVCGKRLSVGNQVWQPQFIKRWKDKFAETYIAESDGKTYWRRKGSAVADPEFGRPVGKGEATLRAADMRKRLSKDEAAEAIHIMLQLLCAQHGNNHVMNFALVQGILKPGQALEEWPQEKIATKEWEVKKLLDEIGVFIQGAKIITGWQEFKVPFGKNKGKTLHDLNKRQIAAFLREIPSGTYPEFAAALVKADEHYKRKG